MVYVARHINGIALNPFEYLLDEKGNLLLFPSEEDAKAHLRQHGVAETEMDEFIFKEEGALMLAVDVATTAG